VQAQSSHPTDVQQELLQQQEKAVNKSPDTSHFQAKLDNPTHRTRRGGIRLLEAFRKFGSLPQLKPHFAIRSQQQPAGHRRKEGLQGGIQRLQARKDSLLIRLASLGRQAQALECLRQCSRYTEVYLSRLWPWRTAAGACVWGRAAMRPLADCSVRPWQHHPSARGIWVCVQEAGLTHTCTSFLWAFAASKQPCWWAASEVKLSTASDVCALLACVLVGEAAAARQGGAHA